MYVIFLLCAAMSWLLTPVLCHLARHIGFVDRPDGRRKIQFPRGSAFVDQPNQRRKYQKRPVPLGGGLAVLISVTAIVLWGYASEQPWTLCFQEEAALIASLFGAAVVIVALGLIDDFYGIAGFYKLLGQVVAVSLLIGGGAVSQTVRVSEIDISLGIFAVPFTLFWLIGAVNSINLLDGLDGFASVIAVGMSISLAAVALALGHPAIALLATMGAGAIVGFAWFNLPPAKIYLGDAGSMLVGLLLGVVTLRATSVDGATMMLAPAIAIWTIPIFDSVAAIIRRLGSGQSILQGDSEHLHHRLLRRFTNHWMVLVWAGSWSLVTGGAALLGIYLSNDLLPILVLTSTVSVAVLSRTFGYAELCRIRRFLPCGELRGAPSPDGNDPKRFDESVPQEFEQAHIHTNRPNLTPNSLQRNDSRPTTVEACSVRSEEASRAAADPNGQNTASARRCDP